MWLWGGGEEGVCVGGGSSGEAIQGLVGLVMD